MDNILIYIFIVLLLISILYDIKTKSIPNIITLALICLSIYMRLYDLNGWFIGASTFILPFILIYGYISDILDREVIGFGDIKLTIALGGLLYDKVDNLFLSVYIFYLIAFVSAAIYLLIFYTLKALFKKKEKTNKTIRNKKICFSSFLIFSFFIHFYFYGHIIALVEKYV